MKHRLAKKRMRAGVCPQCGSADAATKTTIEPGRPARVTGTLCDHCGAAAGLHGRRVVVTPFDPMGDEAFAAWLLGLKGHTP